MKTLRHAIAGLFALGACGAVSAAYIQLDIPEKTFSLQSLTNGGNYPVSGSLSAGGVPFNIATDGTFDVNGNPNNMWQSFVQPTVNPLVIPVNVYGVHEAYTLMDSFFGSCGATIGTVRFIGSAGGDVTFNLVEGQNIRDHFTGPFCNTIAPGTPSIDFGGDVHLDMQTYDLPVEFDTQTLLSITITSLSLGGAGEPLITSATVLVPEPGTLALLGLSLAGLGYARRKRSQ